MVRIVKCRVHYSYFSCCYNKTADKVGPEEKQGLLLLTIWKDTVHLSRKTWQQVHELACHVASAVRKQRVARKWGHVTKQGPPLIICLRRPGLLKALGFLKECPARVQTIQHRSLWGTFHIHTTIQSIILPSPPDSLKITMFSIKVQS